MSVIRKNTKRHIKFVYVFKCNIFNVVKIGVSSDPIKRLIRLNDEAKHHNFSVLVTKEFQTSESCFAFEKYLHNSYKDFKVVTGNYGGYTEIFSDEITESLLEQFDRSKYKIKRIDPYLTLIGKCSKLDVLSLYEDFKDLYRMIFADLWVAKENGFDGIYCTSNYAHHTGKRIRYLRAFNSLSGNGIILCSDYEIILKSIEIGDILISYKDRMLQFIEQATLTCIIQTVSIMEYFSSNRERGAIFRKILRKRGLSSTEVNAMQVAYKQVMKTDMNCRLDIK